MKTTQKQFEIFQEEVQKWVDELGLYEWDFHISTDDMDAHGECMFDSKSRKVVIDLASTLNKVNKLPSELKRCALHEVLHVLIGKLYIMARDREWDEDAYTDEEHVVINRLIKVLGG